MAREMPPQDKFCILPKIKADEGDAHNSNQIDMRLFQNYHDYTVITNEIFVEFLRGLTDAFVRGEGKRRCLIFQMENAMLFTDDSSTSNTGKQSLLLKVP